MVKKITAKNKGHLLTQVPPQKRYRILTYSSNINCIQTFFAILHFK